MPFLYSLGKGQERSFPCTSTLIKGRAEPVQISKLSFLRIANSRFLQISKLSFLNLNGYPLESAWTEKGNKAFFTRLRDLFQRVALSCLKESTLVDGVFFYLYLELLDQLLPFETSGVEP